MTSVVPNQQPLSPGQVQELRGPALGSSWNMDRVVALADSHELLRGRVVRAEAHLGWAVNLIEHLRQFDPGTGVDDGQGHREDDYLRERLDDRLAEIREALAAGVPHPEETHADQ